MITCPNCRTKNLNEYEHCKECGRSLYQYCENSSCNQRFPVDVNFCPYCSTKVFTSCNYRGFHIDRDDSGNYISIKDNKRIACWSYEEVVEQIDLALDVGWHATCHYDLNKGEGNFPDN